MKETNEHPAPPAEKAMLTNTEELFQKAALVHEKMMVLRSRLDQSVFVGASKDGLLRIDLYGDGRPHSVSFLIPLPEEEKKLFENEIFEALDDVYQCRISQMKQELEDIRGQVGDGPDFQMPF